MKKKLQSVHINKHPTNTVTQCRVGMFYPGKQIPANYSGDIIIENMFGKCEIKNHRLTQIHRNLIDCIMTYNHKIYIGGDGSVSFIFNMYEIQKRLGIAKNNEWVKEKLEELRITKVKTTLKNGITIFSGIVHKYAYSKIEKPEHNNKFGKHKYFYVRFESEYMLFFYNDLHIYYQKLLPNILSLPNCELQALVRFIISHREWNSSIVNTLILINSIRDGISDRSIRDKLKNVTDSAEILKEQFNIEIKTVEKTGEIGIFYRQHPDVWFKNPLKIIEIQEKSAEDTH